MQVRSFRDTDAIQWDEFCDNAFAATFLHTRQFLSYHGDRFLDQSLIFEDDGHWIGIFPAAQHLHDEACIVSHPGITYGGLLHSGRLHGEGMIEAMECIRRYYSELGYKRLIYKAVPHIYHRAPAEDDLYVLFRLGAQRIRCDLSSTADLANRLPKSERRRRCLKKAQTAGIYIEEDAKFTAPLWKVLTENLARKHDVKPAHSLNEISLLARRFPNNIRFVAGLLNDKVEAGVVLFVTQMTHHAQYITASTVGNRTCALDMVFEHCMTNASMQGARWFDFGISTMDSGQVLNAGLHHFKSEFGCGGVVHEFLELSIP